MRGSVRLPKILLKTVLTLATKQSAAFCTRFSEAPKFNDSNPRKLQILIGPLQKKINAEGTSYANPEAQLRYKFKRLENKTLEQVTHYRNEYTSDIQP